MLPKENKQKIYTGTNSEFGSYKFQYSEWHVGWSLWLCFPDGRRYERHGMLYPEIGIELRAIGFMR